MAHHKRHVQGKSGVKFRADAGDAGDAGDDARDARSFTLTDL